MTGSGDQTCRVWDVETRRFLVSLRGHTGSIKSVSTREGAPWAVASGSRDGTVGLWDLRSPTRTSARTTLAAAQAASRAPTPEQAAAASAAVMQSGAHHLPAHQIRVRVLSHPRFRIISFYSHITPHSTTATRPA